MAEIERQGVRIYFEDHGGGTPVLLTHGYSATSEMWRGQVEALGTDFRVITWDLRGHGRSDSPADESLYGHDLAVDDMAAILDACGVQSAVVGGLSLGGFLSLEMYRRHPQRVRALMLFDTGPGYKNEKGRAAWNRMAGQLAEGFESQGLAALGDSPEVRASSHRSAAGLARAARGMLRQFDSAVIESLPSITLPTLVMVGANDRPFIGSADYMAAKIPGARKVVIADAGHAPNIDQPAAFNATVRAFLTELVDSGK